MNHRQIRINRYIRISLEGDAGISLRFLIFSVISMTLLAKATQTLPIGVAYPVWTGIGAVGTVLVGIIFFHEPVTFWRMLFTLTLIASIIGLKALS